MTNSTSLSQILLAFSYWHAMNDEPFKPRAYQLASESVAALGADVERAWKKGGFKSLEELPGIGPAIAKKMDEYFRTGKIAEYEELKRRFPVEIWELSQIEGLGPRHIQELWEQLHVQNLTDLKRVLKAQKVRTLPGFGIKSEERLAQRLALMESAPGRKPLKEVLPIAKKIVAKLSKVPGVRHCVIAGSLRRKKATIGDIDLIATSDNPAAVMSAFVHLPDVTAIHEHGKTRSSVRLKCGLDADLRVVPDEVFGAALQYFTGDRRHNIFLRERAIRQGYKLNEYGLFRGNKRVAGKTEEEIYEKLGVKMLPPEQRIGLDVKP